MIRVSFMFGVVIYEYSFILTTKLVKLFQINLNFVLQSQDFFQRT